MTIVDADLRICASFNRLNGRPALSRFFGSVSRLGDGAFWYVLMLATPLIDPGEGWYRLLLMVTAGVSCTLVYKLLKRSTCRVRPCDADEQLLVTVAPLDRFSFPSGHTLHAVCFTILATAHEPLLGWLLIPFAVLVALSRLVLGLHYPSDVAAGAAIGTTVAAATLAIAG